MFGRDNIERAAFSDDARLVLYAQDGAGRDQFAAYRISNP
jgi:hypothetical protein